MESLGDALIPRPTWTPSRFSQAFGLWHQKHGGPLGSTPAAPPLQLSAPLAKGELADLGRPPLQTRLLRRLRQENTFEAGILNPSLGEPQANERPHLRSKVMAPEE